MNSRVFRSVDEFLDEFDGDDMSRQVVVREKKVSHKGITIESDAEGNVTVTSAQSTVKLRFTEGEFISMVDTSTNIIEWKSEEK
jgi:hypothetical protein